MASKAIASPEGIDRVVEISRHSRGVSLSPLKGGGESRCLSEAIAKLGCTLMVIIMSVEMRIPEELTGEVLAPVEIR